MMHKKLKILFCITIGLVLLFAPFLLGNSPDGKAYAMGFLGSSGGGDQSSGSGVAGSKHESNNETSPDLYATGPSGQDPPAPVPEPATLLLFGAGAVGLAAFRKKFRKK